MKKKRLMSVFLIVMVIVVLLLSGPVSAITVSVTSDKSTYYNASDATITITGTINIEDAEILNITEFNVLVENTTTVVKNCTVSTSGSVSGCTNVTASVTYNGNYVNGTRFGYGYGYNTVNGPYTTANQTFGAGYGYTATTGQTNEVVITVTWNISGDTAAALADDYTANILVKNEGGGNTRYYLDSTDAEFTLNSGSEPVITSSTSGSSKLTGYCSPDWVCNDWSECKEGVQTRRCRDKWECGKTDRKPEEKQECEAPIVEVESVNITEITAEEESIVEEETEEVVPLGIDWFMILFWLVVLLFLILLIRRKKESKR